jgi:hypothetical protein
LPSLCGTDLLFPFASSRLLLGTDTRLLCAELPLVLPSRRLLFDATALLFASGRVLDPADLLAHPHDHLVEDCLCLSDPCPLAELAEAEGKANVP